MSGVVPDAYFESVEALDRELTRLAQKSGSLRLALGLGLDALARTGGYSALGFPSLHAYSLERCERSASWTRETRLLASRVSALPMLRAALTSGRISWSMAGEIAEVATAEDEVDWLRVAGQCTIKTFRQLVRALRGEEPPADADASEDRRDERRILTVTADRDEGWLLACAEIVHRHMDGGSVNELVQALVFEGLSTLREVLPQQAEEPGDLTPKDDAQRAWNRRLARLRDEAELLTEEHVVRHKWEGTPSELLVEEFDFAGPPQSIDRAMRRISRQLAEREVAIGELADRFWKADGWRRLGYATSAQYAKERLGMSIASLTDRRQLALRLNDLPSLKWALLSGDIGFEAAYLTAVVATRETDEAWALRARDRTLVHLEEDIRAAALLAQVGRRDVIEPPSAEVATEIRALEAAVVTGAVFRAASGAHLLTGAPGSAPAEAEEASRRAAAASDVAALWKAFHEARHAPAHLRSASQEVLRFRVRPDTRSLYRGVERLFVRHSPLRMSFLRFLCLNFIETWTRELPDMAYAHIYARDGLRCTNPVCTGRDCRPHHIRLRSPGGADGPWDLTTLCSRCRLDGLASGPLTISGTAPELTWRLGRHTTVIGRTRRRAA